MPSLLRSLAVARCRVGKGWRGRLWGPILAASLLASLTLAAPPGQAAFPGDNGRIAFSKQLRFGNPSENNEIFTINPDGTGQAQLTDTETIQDEDAAFSADGTKIAFSSFPDGNYDIYVMNAANSSGPRQAADLTRLPRAGLDGIDTEPTFSPDGQKIAFRGYHDTDNDGEPDNADIYVMNAADGSGLTRLTDHEAGDFDPVWSPDGEKIAFASGRGGGAVGIYTMDAADGSDVTRLSGGTDPTFSPDGSKIAFSSNGISTMNAADGSDVKSLTNGENPAFSPDGKKIAFEAFGLAGSGNLDIYTITLTSTEPDLDRTNLTNSLEFDDYLPDWGVLPGTSTLPDTTAPPPPAITSPGDNAYDRDGSFTVGGTAESASTVRLYEGAALRGTARATTTGTWSVALRGVPAGRHVYTARATDAAGNTSSASTPRAWLVDKTRPTVSAVSPAAGATGVSTAANVLARFSEPMRATTITRTTVKLVRRGTRRAVSATVTYNAARRLAKLDPTRRLARGAIYDARVAWARDRAGNPLARPKRWSFRTRR